MKKCLGLFLISILVLTEFAQGTMAQGFKDLKTAHRFYPEIQYLTEKSIITGFPDETFRSDVTVTRAQAAIMIGKALKLDGKQRDTKFPDVKAYATASGYIDSAVEKGIISGFPDNTFRPDEPVNRGQMAIFLARAFKLTEESSEDFKDVVPNMTAYTYIKKIIADGITAGYDDRTFKPYNSLSRAAFSAFLARALDDQFKVTIPSNEMTVDFIGMTNGDSIFIKTPNGKTILIDGGVTSRNLPFYIMEQSVSSIDLLVSTNPAPEHIGGLADTLITLPVKQVLESGAEGSSPEYQEYLSVIDDKNIPVETADEGEFIELDPSLKIQVLNAYDEGEDLSEGSLVLKVTYNEIDFLLTSDANSNAELKMLDQYNVEAEILKAGNHGSSTSASEAFLQEVSPQASIIMNRTGSGSGNQMLHPDAVKRLIEAGSSVYTTESTANIRIKTDGKTFIIYGTPDYIPGE